ncbi:GntR family transcriptional regulator [Marispirochaeta sp.]|jgi:DNA-binding GntR family transcriptional regulator|uniref:GntR family transcriptional regulator n=1 Tax=Marispirochaeta sp. TaxID=2038653 RepID=UPI0029C941C4|nr:GntR family transcriptional regulator [Marispirochaeta sp.]
MDISEIERPKTKEELVYEQLKELILHSGIPVNTFLSQRTLAAKVDAAVITVRAALRQLENDGLVENIPHWGVRVPEETPATLEDRYRVRRLFEVEASREIVKRRSQIDPSDLLKIASQCDRIDLDPDGDLNAFGDLHYRLHREIVDLAGSPLMSRMYERINLKKLFFWNALRTWKDASTRHIGDHREFVEGLFSAPEEAVVKMLEQHINRGLEYELRMLNSQDTL